jgi:hypothetical protein
MRLATFEIRAGGDAEDRVVEVTLSRFPGEVGGELANVNRWRQQVELPPLEANELDEAIQRFGDARRPGYFVRIEGDAILLAAGIFEAERDRTWFVKSTVESTTTADALTPEIIEFAEALVHRDDANAAEPTRPNKPPSADSYGSE